MIIGYDLAFVQVIYFRLLSYDLFVQGYAAREFVKQGLKAGELAIFSAEKVRRYNSCVPLIAWSAGQRPWNSSALKYFTFRCLILVCHVISANWFFPQCKRCVLWPEQESRSRGVYLLVTSFLLFHIFLPQLALARIPWPPWHSWLSACIAGCTVWTPCPK